MEGEIPLGRPEGQQRRVEKGREVADGPRDTCWRVRQEAAGDGLSELRNGRI
jgi:hypothetical protein